MTRVAIDRTENDPDIFREILDEFEGRAITPLPTSLQPRDPSGRFTKKEPNHE
jgi:hypothetical protein